MNFHVGQQIFDGLVVVLDVTDDYVLISIPLLGDARGPFTIGIYPHTTEAALRGLVDALLDVVPRA